MAMTVLGLLEGAPSMGISDATVAFLATGLRAEAGPGRGTGADVGTGADIVVVMLR